MFKLNEIQSLFICPICKTTLQDPIALPCGSTICKQHCEEIIKDDCQFCKKNHIMPEDGFVVNKIINTQLELKVDKINMSFPQYEDYKKTLEDLNKGLKEVETITRYPFNSPYDQIGINSNDRIYRFGELNPVFIVN